MGLMAQSFEIPLIAAPQTFTLVIDTVPYRFRLRYCDTPMGGWILDIYDQFLNPLACGLPLVTGSDLMEQLAYVGIAGSAYVATDGAWPVTPTHDNLGTGSHLYWYM